MTLINTNGMAFIGPGSEWFWSLLQFLVVGITLVAIFRQVRLQASQGAIQQAEALSRDWSSERMVRSRLTVMRAIRDGANLADLPAYASSEIADFYERVGYLAREGHLDREVVYEYFGTTIRTWWTFLRPSTEKIREDAGSARASEHFEWLAGFVAALDRKGGEAVTYDVAQLTPFLGPTIEALVDALRDAEELRAVIVRPMSPASPTPETSEVADHRAPPIATASDR